MLRWRNRFVEESFPQSMLLITIEVTTSRRTGLICK
jgi:hypothetical protein